jgi:hypothetical protein
MAKISSSPNPTIVDAASLFYASEVIADRVGRKVTVDYAKLREVLDSLREQHGWRPSSVNMALLSIDPASEGQQRFQSMLRHSGFEPDVIHYRDAFVSLPPGRSLTELRGDSIVSLSARIAYIAGLMARHPDPHFLVVSHSFELYCPLADLRERIGQKGEVGIAYFGSLMDFRWKGTGLFDDKLNLTFFDLDPYGNEILGVDLIGRPNTTANGRSGLSRF